MAYWGEGMSKYLRFLAWTVGIIAVVVGLLRLVLFEAWTVPEDDSWLGASVAPTLQAGDTVLLLTRGTPGFGDLVRCTDPEDPSDWVIGRIIGLERDQIEVQEGSLSVNGTRYRSAEACKKTEFTIEHPDTGSEIELRCSRVEMGGGWHFVGSLTKRKKSDNKKHQVGVGLVYLLSDNRSFHDDSRDFGPVPAESCSERIVFRLWSSDGWSDSERRLDVIR